MALLELWRDSPKTIQSYAIRQIVAVAGDGRIRENSECSSEMRAFLAEVGTDKLSAYATECLIDGFDQSGFVLQDVINEIGRRLDFEVANGRYQGTASAIGYDGIWRAGLDRAVVVEVKTTDAYNVRLDKVAEYRQRLIVEEGLPDTSSVLFVVGRKDTGALEAQIRGSRHAWDMRVIGVDSLIKLMLVREKSSSKQTTSQIRELLQPFEYTRLDKIVEVIFDTASDVEQTTEADILEDTEHSGADDADDGKRTQLHSDPDLLEAKRKQIASALQPLSDRPLIRKKSTRVESADGDFRAIVATSKRYTKGFKIYWYAFHEVWRESLAAAKQGYFVLGCLDRAFAYAIPLSIIEAFLPKLNMTERPNRPPYWHIELVDSGGDQLALYSSPTGERLELAPYAIPLKV